MIRIGKQLHVTNRNDWRAWLEPLIRSFLMPVGSFHGPLASAVYRLTGKPSNCRMRRCNLEKPFS